jgi:hypothetical protein
MGYDVVLTDAHVGAADIDIDTKSGQIRVRMDVTDIVLDIEVDTSIFASPAPATITIDRVEGEARFDPSVGLDGLIDVGMDTLSLEVSGLDMNLDLELGIFADAFDAIVDASIGAAESGIVDTLEDQLSTSIPEMLEDALSSLAISTDVDIAGSIYTVSVVPERVDVKARGVELPMLTKVTPASEIAAYLAEGPTGSPYEGYATPTFVTADGGLEIAFSLDFFNQVFRALWAGGMMDTAMTDEDLGVDMAEISLIMPGLSDLTLRTEALLPAVVVLNPDEESKYQVYIQVGDLYVQVHDGPVTEDSLYMELYVSGFAPAEVGLNADGTAFTFDIGDPTVYVDVIEGGTSPLAPERAEAVFDVLMPLVLPEFGGGLTSIPLPGLDGFSLGGVELVMMGPDGKKGYACLAGNLTVE